MKKLEGFIHLCCIPLAVCVELVSIQFHIALLAWYEGKHSVSTKLSKHFSCRESDYL